jgi:site-specific DNA recombinase
MAREQGRQRTRDAMVRKARHGHVAGGMVYGYRNVRHADHVERVIDPTEARIICRIFEACAAGKGFVRIARALNGDGIPGPRGRSWAPAAIREMLYRDLYAGRIIYGKTTWTYQDGRRVKVDTPPSEWITLEVPALRIVEAPLWTAARERLHQTRAAYIRLAGGNLWGRPETGLESQYLLTGLAACGVCGASLHVRLRGPRDGRADYRCGYHYARGATVCPNARTLPMADANAAVLATLHHDVLTPEAVTRVVTAALATVRDRPDTPRAGSHRRPDRTRPGDHRTAAPDGRPGDRAGVRVGAGRDRQPRVASDRASGPPGAPRRAPARRGPRP